MNVISNRTRIQVAGILADWAAVNNIPTKVLLTLLDRLTKVKGNKSFKESVEMIYQGFEERINRY